VPVLGVSTSRGKLSQAAEAPDSLRARASDGAAMEASNCVGSGYIVLAADLHMR
jgi:hypothetical protein